MLERPADPEEVRPTLEMIRQNVELEARLIDDLLDVTRIVRGKMPLHWEVADCHALIDQAVADLPQRGPRQASCGWCWTWPPGSTTSTPTRRGSSRCSGT